jgi:hypothetical protein
MEGISATFTVWPVPDDIFQLVWKISKSLVIFTQNLHTMKNLFVAFLLTAFVGAGYIAKAAPVTVSIVKGDDDDKKNKKSCSSKKSCCKMKAGEAKACAGMAKEEASANTEASAAAGTAAKPACAGEKKACCKKKAASCTSEKEKSTGGAIN